jgi:ADP-heptose:LPS heptosyltransferase
MGRANTRLRLVLGAAAAGLVRRSRKPTHPRTILVAHQLLLGDTLMLAGLFSALRTRYPEARIVTTCAPACVPLFAGRPWGVEAVGYDPRMAATLRHVRAKAGKEVDLAVLPGDNRHALLAWACRARWVMGFVGDSPAWKNALCDELLPWPAEPAALVDMFAALAETEPAPYLKDEWIPPPPPAGFVAPAGLYAVLHLGAGNPLRRWAPEAWSALAARLAESGLDPVITAGPGEEALVRAIDPDGKYRSHPGDLPLTGMWHLLAGAALAVCPDSGVAHLAKLTATPAVCLFGQGSDVLFGPGRYFSQVPFISLIEQDMPCRDQRTLFGREIEWVRRCARRPGDCNDPVCMRALTVDKVFSACRLLLEDHQRAAT